MPRIPTAEDLGRRNPSRVSGPVTGPNVSLAADLKAVETTAAQQGMAEWEDRVANEELAKAEVQFQLGAMAEAEKYKNDTDLDTVEERHAAGMKDQLGKASANITSAKTRAMFIIRGEEGMARANQNMSDRVTKKKNDLEKGHMANAIDLMVKGGQDLEYGDPGTAITGIQLTLDSMVERDVISNVEAQSMIRKAQLDMAYGRLKAMDPKQQLAILNDEKATWVNDVPPDVIRQLKEQAEAQEMNNAALRRAFAMQDLEEADGLAALEQQFINGELDDEEYEKTRLRFQRVKNDQEVENQVALDDYYEEGMAEIYAGTTSVKQIESSPGGIEMMKRLSPAQRANLFAAEDEAMKRAAGQGRKYSDVEVVKQLQHYMATDQAVKGRKYWSENYAKLNMSDFKYFNVATSPTKSIAPEFKPIRTARQLMTEFEERGNKMTPDQEAKVWNRLEARSKDYYHTNQGKEAPKEMVNDWLREEYLDVVTHKGTFYDTDKKVYEMDDEERTRFEQVAAVFQDVVEDELTTEQLLESYNKMDEDQRDKVLRLRETFPSMSASEILTKVVQN